MPTNKSVSLYMEEELKQYMTPEATEFLLSEWYRFMFQYIPFRTGMLASLAEPVIDGISPQLTPEQAMLMGLDSISQTKNYIHFRAPYASVQNGGDDFNFTKDLHPLAQAHWEQVAADLHGESIINAVKKFIAYQKGANKK